MPNLIEQQDLLKGLTDERLSGLLQNPVAEIPPFLVAAEAQRRQAIRQQFAGQDQQESVVDSLTKQLAGVPENIKSSAPSPQAPQGIAAIQQPQQTNMQQQQQQPQQDQQQMRDGGYVQRYAEGALVEPNSYYIDPFGAPAPSADEGVFEFPSFGDIAYNARLKLEGWKTPEQVAKEKAQQAATASMLSPQEGAQDIGAQLRMQNMRSKEAVVPTANQKVAPRNPYSSAEDTSTENQKAPEEDKIRSQLEAILGGDERSKWEDAQKWFAVSQQFLKPNSSLLEGLVNAGQVYASASAAQDKEEADRKREAALQLLQYDVGERDADRASAAEAGKRKWELYLKQLGWNADEEKANRITPKDEFSAVNSEIKALGDAISKLDPLASDTEKMDLQKRLDDAIARRESLRKTYGGFDYSGSYVRNPDGTIRPVQ